MSAIAIEPVDDLDCRVVVHDWAFARERASDIAAHWDAQLLSGRRLWNGRVLLARDPHIVERQGRRVLASTHFETDFAAFLAFRDWGFPDPNVRNCFAMAALRSSDGVFLLARMGAHTANPGRVYFAAGTPDPADIVEGRLDLAGSVYRELEEETGLRRADVTEAAGYTLVIEGGRIAVMKELRTHASAADVIAQVDAFVAAEREPEIDGLVAVCGLADLSAGEMPDFIQAYLRERLRYSPPG